MDLLGHIFGETRLHIDGRADRAEGGLRRTLGSPEDSL